MWMRILRLLLQYANSRNEFSSAPIVSASFRLLDSLCNIQSEPSETMPDAQCAVADFESFRPAIEDIVKRMRRDRHLSSTDVFVLALLADTMFQLESRWSGYYEPTFGSHADVGLRVTSIRQFLRKIPFAVGIDAVAQEWQSDCDALHGTIVSIFVTTCAQNGICGDQDLYAKVTDRLMFDAPFLLTVVCAYCVKMLAERSLVDVRVMSRDQYECMALLDNFYTGPEGAWG